MKAQVFPSVFHEMLDWKGRYTVELEHEDGITTLVIRKAFITDDLNPDDFPEPLATDLWEEQDARRDAVGHRESAHDAYTRSRGV